MRDGRSAVSRRAGPRLWLSAAWLTLVAFCAVFAPLISPHDPLAQDLFAARLPPFACTVHKGAGNLPVAPDA